MWGVDVWRTKVLKSKINICGGKKTVGGGCWLLRPNCNTKILSLAAGVIFEKWFSNGQVR